MNLKNFLLAGIAGGITDFLLGWIFYGMLLHGYFGGGEPKMEWIVAGCLSFGLFVSYIFVRWANFTTFGGGLQGGAAIGFFMGLIRHFFDSSMGDNPLTLEQMAVDFAVGIVMGAIVGGVVAAVNGSMSKPANA